VEEEEEEELGQGLVGMETMVMEEAGLGWEEIVEEAEKCSEEKVVVLDRKTD
jgi:hypothetical protein